MQRIALPQIESQPDFPDRDISEANAESLGLVLASQSLVDDIYAKVGPYRSLIQLGGDAICKVASRVIEDERAVDAVRCGTRLYAVAAALLVAERREDDMQAAIAAAGLLGLGDTDVLNHQVISLDAMQNERPMLATAVREGAHRYCGHHTHYAELGVALSLDMERRALTADW